MFCPYRRPLRQRDRQESNSVTISRRPELGTSFVTRLLLWRPANQGTGGSVLNLATVCPVWILKRFLGHQYNWDRKEYTPSNTDITRLKIYS